MAFGRDPSGRFKPGTSGNPRGRKRGVPNTLTADLRTMIREALEAEGGVAYLRWAAREEPRAFLALLGRLIPAEVRAAVESDSIPTVVIRDFSARASEVDSRGSV